MLTFLGRVNSLKRQTFKSGTIRVYGPEGMRKVNRPVPDRDEKGEVKTDKDGKIVYRDNWIERPGKNCYQLKVKDIGNEVDLGEDESYILDKYPHMFKKAGK